MRARTIAGALASLLWAASCVSILDVSAEDYEDLDETICRCANAQDACQVVVQDLLKREGAAETARDCLAESETCPDLDTCLFGAGLCAAIEKRCSADGDAKLQIRCCDETLSCDGDGRCSAPACSLAGQNCLGGPSCCEGLVCNGGGTCCVGGGGSCEARAECCDPAQSCVRRSCDACIEIQKRCETTEDCCGDLECLEGDAGVRLCRDPG